MKAFGLGWKAQTVLETNELSSNLVNYQVHFITPPMFVIKKKARLRHAKIEKSHTTSLVVEGYDVSHS